MTYWRNLAHLGELFKSSVSDPGSGLMTKSVSLVDHSRIAVMLRRGMQYPKEPSNLIYGHTLDSYSN